MLRESLQEGADNHDQGTDHDTPTSSISAVDPWCDGDSDDRAELVARVDETEHTRLKRVLFWVLRVHDTIAEIFIRSDSAVPYQVGKHSHLLKGWENCSVPMSCESKPEVISTPMQQQKSQRYNSRRFGFLYHGTLSSATMRVMMGSEVPSLALKTPMLTVVSAVKAAGETRQQMGSTDLIHGTRQAQPFIYPGCLPQNLRSLPLRMRDSATAIPKEQAPCRQAPRHWCMGLGNRVNWF
jgi:hypothetical protein